MNQITSNPYDLSSGELAVRNRVLRNTYWLLALSLIPTVFGALVGVQFQVPVPTGIVGFILFMAVVYGFFYAIEKTKNSAAGIGVLFGFTFFMGLMLTPLLTRTLGYSNGGSLIMLAFGGTAAVFATMASIATVSKRDFSSMGKTLAVITVVLIVAILANFLLKMPMLSIIISVAVIGLCSAYLLYNVQRVVNGGETNYISATMSIFLDVYIMFSHMLSLLGLGGSRD
jgi:modulator of FtsH protease